MHVNAHLILPVNACRRVSIALGGRGVVRGGDVITVRGRGLLLAAVAAAECAEEVVLLDDLVLRGRVVAELGQPPQLPAGAVMAVTVPLRRRRHRRRGRRDDIGFWNGKKRALSI